MDCLHGDEEKSQEKEWAALIFRWHHSCGVLLRKVHAATRQALRLNWLQEQPRPFVSLAARPFHGHTGFVQQSSRYRKKPLVKNFTFMQVSPTSGRNCRFFAAETGIFRSFWGLLTRCAC
jgi:hypothetical protein